MLGMRGQAGEHGGSEVVVEMGGRGHGGPWAAARDTGQGGGHGGEHKGTRRDTGAPGVHEELGEGMGDTVLAGGGGAAQGPVGVPRANPPPPARGRPRSVPPSPAAAPRGASFVGPSPPRAGGAGSGAAASPSPGAEAPAAPRRRPPERLHERRRFRVPTGKRLDITSGEVKPGSAPPF